MSKDYCFPAGEMTVKEKKVHANPDRGILRFYINKDTQLLSMKWENLENLLIVKKHIVDKLNGQK